MGTNSATEAARAPFAYGTQTIQRAAVLLRLLTYHNRSGLRLVDLAAFSNLERPTVHRMLHGLIDENLVVQDQATKRYFLGPAVYEMGLAASPKNHLRDISQPYLQWVADNAGVTVFLTVRSGFDGVCIYRKDGTPPMKAKIFVQDFDIGQHRPLGMGTGCMAILSALPAEIADRIIAVNQQRQVFARESITLKQLREQLVETRDKGYATRTLSADPKLSAIGVAIPGEGREPIGAVSLRELSSRLTGKWRDRLVCILGRAVGDIGLEVRKNLNGQELKPLWAAAQKQAVSSQYAPFICWETAAQDQVHSASGAKSS
jgi:DNA-binding IclR family transcriptional regulator